MTIINVIVYVRYENLLVSVILFGISIILGSKKTIILKNEYHKVDWTLYFQSFSQNIAGILFKHADIIFIQLLLGYTIVGDYAIVVSFSSLASFGLMALNSNSQRELIEMREAGKINAVRIQNISKISFISGLLLSAITILLFYIYSEYINPEYNLDIGLLCILLIARVINTFTGPVALLLNVFVGPKIVANVTMILLAIKSFFIVFLGSNLIEVVAIIALTSVAFTTICYILVMRHIKVNTLSWIK